MVSRHATAGHFWGLCVLGIDLPETAGITLRRCTPLPITVRLCDQSRCMVPRFGITSLACRAFVFSDVLYPTPLLPHHQTPLAPALVVEHFALLPSKSGYPSCIDPVSPALTLTHSQLSARALFIKHEIHLFKPTISRIAVSAACITDSSGERLLKMYSTGSLRMY